MASVSIDAIGELWCNEKKIGRDCLNRLICYLLVKSKKNFYNFCIDFTSIILLFQSEKGMISSTKKLLRILGHILGEEHNLFSKSFPFELIAEKFAKFSGRFPLDWLPGKW